MEKWKGLCALHRKWMSDTSLQTAHFQELLSRYFDNAHSLGLLPSCSPCTFCAAACSLTREVRGRRPAPADPKPARRLLQLHVGSLGAVAGEVVLSWQPSAAFVWAGRFCLPHPHPLQTLKKNSDFRCWLGLQSLWSCSSQTAAAPQLSPCSDFINPFYFSFAWLREVCAFYWAPLFFMPSLISKGGA